MSEAVIAHWEVTRAKNAGQKANPHGGQFDKWYLSLQNLDGGTDCEDAYWQRKAPSTVDVGDRVYGKLEEGDYGFRFFLEKDEEGGSRPSGGSTETKTSNSPKSETDWGVRNAEIRRQHSQGEALVALQLAGYPSDGDWDLLKEAIKEWADWFDLDAEAAGQFAILKEVLSPAQAVDLSGARTQEPGQNAHQGAAPTNSSPQRSSSPDAAPGEPSANPSLNFPKSDLPDVDRDHVMQLLSSAGLIHPAAQEKVADYILTQLSVAGREKAALSGLQDFERQASVLAQLKVETEKWIGSPLPQGDALDGVNDVPF